MRQEWRRDGRRRTRHTASDLPATAGRCFRRSHAFRRDRFETLVQYVCWICEDPRALGLERLNRILWYVDRTVCSDPRSGRHRRHLHPPSRRAVGRPLEAVLRDLERRGLVAQRPRVGDREPDLLVSLARPDLAGFDPEEISLVEAVTRALCFDQRATVAIARRARRDPGCGAAGRGDSLLHRVLRPARPRPVPADLAWAIRQSERRKGNQAARPAEAPTGRVRAAVEGCSGTSCATPVWAHPCPPAAPAHGSSIASTATSRPACRTSPASTGSKPTSWCWAESGWRRATTRTKTGKRTRPSRLQTQSNYWHEYTGLIDAPKR